MSSEYRNAQIVSGSPPFAMKWSTTGINVRVNQLYPLTREFIISMITSHAFTIRSPWDMGPNILTLQINHSDLHIFIKIIFRYIPTVCCADKKKTKYTVHSRLLMYLEYYVRKRWCLPCYLTKPIRYNSFFHKTKKSYH